MKKILTMLSLLLALSLCSCTLIASSGMIVKDQNGQEDHSLVVYDDEDLKAEYFDSFCVAYGFQHEGERSDPDEDYGMHDSDLTSASALSDFSGVTVLQFTYGKTDRIKFSVTPTHNAGNMRIVLIDEEGEILYDFPIDSPSSFEVTGAMGKRYQVRVAGESAQFEVVTERTFLEGETDDAQS